jgi:hypothetical protein
MSGMQKQEYKDQKQAQVFFEVGLVRSCCSALLVTTAQFKRRRYSRTACNYNVVSTINVFWDTRGIRFILFCESLDNKANKLQMSLLQEQISHPCFRVVKFDPD